MIDIELGDRVKDIITGIEGIVVGKYAYLYGCRRFALQPEQLTPDGKPMDWITFDEDQLTIVEKGVVKGYQSVVNVSNPGGPMSEPKNK